MSSVDYKPLVDRIRLKLSSWTARFLSYAGRLQLLTSVIASIINFWTTAYRLPSGCIKELEKLCYAFLWSGPDLNAKKAKVAWKDVCKPKREGGLDIRSIREVNQVSCLKLVWRIVSLQPTLWVKWIRCTHLHCESFWMIKAQSTSGSWMWKKLMKYREMAKTMVRVDARNGRNTSFWYDNWSSLGCIFNITDSRGFIDMGIPAHATLASVLCSHRTRRHRVEVLNSIEVEISKIRRKSQGGEDRILWKSANDHYSQKFKTKKTWNMIRIIQDQKEWYQSVWFPYATPKYAFFSWLACQNKLSSGQRISTWNTNAKTNCEFCGAQVEAELPLLLVFVLLSGLGNINEKVPTVGFFFGLG